MGTLLCTHIAFYAKKKLIILLSLPFLQPLV